MVRQFVVFLMSFTLVLSLSFAGDVCEPLSDKASSGNSHPSSTNAETKEDNLTLGKEVSVELIGGSYLGKQIWMAELSKTLYYVGRTRPNNTIPENIFVFADSDTNTYYFRSQEILVNGKTPESFTLTAEADLAPLLLQTEGSCNLCSQVSAVNGLAISKGLDPILLAAKTIETDESVNAFSVHSNLRNLLQRLYDLSWPDGFVEGQDPKLSVMDTLKAVNEFKARQNYAMTASLKSSQDADQKQPSLTLPLETRGQPTKKVRAFIDHLLSGGTAVVGGLVVPEATQALTSGAVGYQFEAPKALLTPYGNRWTQLLKAIPSGISRAKSLNSVIDSIAQGIEPNDKLVAFTMKALFNQVGHAVSALKIITEGPLKDHIVISNSWGVFEIHHKDVFKNGLGYLLVSPAE